VWETWGKASIPESLHYQINNYGNAWWIDVDTLCKKQNLCTQNKDGTYEISLVIENSYDRYLAIALAISAAGLLGCLGYVGYAGVQNARRRR
jgi:D-arabinose 1-dehydrogenase-like Zn-dependent alcohol dehydrogenase